MRYLSADAIAKAAVSACHAARQFGVSVDPIWMVTRRERAADGASVDPCQVAFYAIDALAALYPAASVPALARAFGMSVKSSERAKYKLNRAKTQLNWNPDMALAVFEAIATALRADPPTCTSFRPPPFTITVRRNLTPFEVEYNRYLNGDPPPGRSALDQRRSAHD